MCRPLLLAVCAVAAWGSVSVPSGAIAQNYDRDAARRALGISESSEGNPQDHVRLAQGARPGTDAWFWRGRDYYWGQNQPGRRARPPSFRDGGTFYPSYRYYPYYGRYPRYYRPGPIYVPAPYGPVPYYYGRTPRSYLRRGPVPRPWLYAPGGLHDNLYTDDWWDDGNDFEDWYDD